MPKKEPLYPHVPKSRKHTPSLPSTSDNELKERLRLQEEHLKEGEELLARVREAIAEGKRLLGKEKGESNPGMAHRGTDPEAIKVAERFGLVFDGMMEDLYEFTIAKGPEEAKGITFVVSDLSQVESRLADKLKEFGIWGGNPGEYVTIIDPGKTTFKVGEVVSREAFAKENERVIRLDEKPAAGR